VRREDKNKPKAGKNAHFEKVGCMKNGLYSLYRKGSLNIIQKILAGKYGNFFLRD